MNLTIRKVQAQDTFNILSLCGETDHYRPQIEAISANLLTDEAHREQCYVALVGERLAGFIYGGVVLRTTLLVQFLYVAPAYRSKGIGRMLTETLEKESGCGASIVYYHKSLRGHYERQGYMAGSELEVAVKQLAL